MDLCQLMLVNYNGPLLARYWASKLNDVGNETFLCLNVTGRVAVYSTGPVEQRCAKRQIPITLVPAKKYWAGTVPAVMPTQGRYWPSTTMFTGYPSNLS